MKYLVEPTELSYSQIKSKCRLSGLVYQTVIKKNNNRHSVRGLVEEPTKGVEVGEKAYVEKSDYYFIKNRAIRRYSYLPTGHVSYLSEGGQSGIVPIKPSSFVDLDLKINDILYTKDTTLGEAATIESDNYTKHTFSSGLLKLRPRKNPLYIFAFLKHEYLRDQINAMTTKGSILSHSGYNVLDCEIPFPKDESVIKDVESLMNDLITIESTIRLKHSKAIDSIQDELYNNQKGNTFTFIMPTLDEIRKRKRLDAALYEEPYKRFLFKLEDYKYGLTTIAKMGFYVKRGQNLQESAIGNSVYSERYRANYYRLVRPRDISPFGTIDKIEYLGNARNLDLLRDGDVMFGAEGTYRPTVFFNLKDKKAITNIHGLIVNKEQPSTNDSAFLCAYFWFLAKEGILSALSVGAHGGSVTKDYILDLAIPNFPDHVKDEIAQFYYNENPTSCLTDLGISQLDFKKLELSEQLEPILDDIVFDRK